MGTNSQIIIEGSLFYNNLATDQLATSVMLSDRSKLLVRNTTWQYNKAGTAAAISVFRTSQVELIDSQFLNNVAQQQVGVILIEQDCTGTILRCNFEQNAAI